jgi:hypothetical protein
MPRHGHALVIVSKWRCWQGGALVLRGEECLQSCREGRVGLGPTQNLSMGLIFLSAHKVFDKMPERNLFSNFEKIFGGV